MRRIASVGSMILGVSRSSKRMSPGPYSTVPRMSPLLGLEIGSGKLRQVVSRLLVDLLRLVHDVGLVDLLSPVVRLDLLHRDGHGLLSVAQHVHHVLGDSFGEPPFLRIG